MLKRLAAIIISLFILMGLACNFSPSPGVPTGRATMDTQPAVPSPSPSPSEAPKVVTDAVLDIHYEEGSVNGAEWDSGPGCIPAYIGIIEGMPTQTPPNESHLKVAQDGTLEGRCYFSVDGGVSVSTGNLTGKIDWASGKVTFHLEAKYEALYQGVTTTSTLVLDATGDVNSNDTATGELAWSGTCRAAAPGGLTCGLLDTPQELSVDVTGSCPWKLWFLRN
jgi:hypothetical protein